MSNSAPGRRINSKKKESAEEALNRKKTEFGKFLALVLRHNPGLIWLKLDSNGWADIEELITNMNIALVDQKKEPVTRAFLEEIVREDDKQRYSISEDGWKIRANQGHSVPVDLGLKQAVPPKYLYHGTVERNFHAISVNGLLKMKRNHVHLSENPEVASKVGERHGYPKILRIKAEEMSKKGIKFYLSENNVWLTDLVPPEFIEFSWR